MNDELLQGPYVTFEVLDPEAEAETVISTGEALQSSVQALIDQGEPFRITGTVNGPETSTQEQEPE